VSRSASVLTTVDDYLDVLREWHLARVSLAWLLTALAFLPYVLTWDLIQADVIGKQAMIAIRLPLLALAIVYWAWATQFQIRKLFA